MKQYKTQVIQVRLLCLETPGIYHRCLLPFLYSYNGAVSRELDNIQLYVAE